MSIQYLIEYLKFVRKWTVVSVIILKVEMELEEAIKATKL